MLKPVNSIWDSCLSIIKDSVSAQSYTTWFEPIVPVGFEENLLTIQVPSQFFYEWLEEHYVSLIGKALRQVTDAPCRIKYNITKREEAVNLHKINLSTPTQKQGSFAINPFAIPGLKKNQVDSMLNTRYVFTNYIAGSCNDLARSAGEAIANKPGNNSFNPMMVYSGVGMGKTHLIQAIGNEIKAKFPEKLVLYTAAERFSTQFVESVRTNTQNDFINFYQSLDVLIVDDIQFLTGKEKTQEIFFHVFNHLHQQGKQLILTSDSPAKELKGMDDRLLSRFKWGLTADLKLPDLETRTAILRNRIQNDGMELSDEIVDFIANNIKSSVRDLEGALITLLAATSFGRTIDLAAARESLSHIIKTDSQDLSIENIKKMVAAHQGITLEAMVGTSRKREIVQARQIAMFLAKKFTQYSLKTIGSHFGNRDHSTVIHSCSTVDNLMVTERKFKTIVDDLQKKLKAIA